MTSDSSGSPSGWSVSALIISIVTGVLLGFAAGAAADRVVASTLETAGRFSVGLVTAIVVALVVGVISYQALTRRR